MIGAVGRNAHAAADRGRERMDRNRILAGNGGEEGNGFVDARVLSIFEGADETLALRVIARRLAERAAG